MTFRTNRQQERQPKEQPSLGREEKQSEGFHGQTHTRIHTHKSGWETDRSAKSSSIKSGHVCQRLEKHHFKSHLNCQRHAVSHVVSAWELHTDWSAQQQYFNLARDVGFYVFMLVWKVTLNRHMWKSEWKKVVFDRIQISTCKKILMNPSLTKCNIATLITIPKSIYFNPILLNLIIGYS